METASRVMYSIANVFSWIAALVYAAGLVFSILSVADVFHLFPELQNYGVGSIVAFAIVLFFTLLTIMLVRKAKSKNSSKFWDVLFIILGILGWNIFYFLGGIFGVVAIRR